MLTTLRPFYFSSDVAPDILLEATGHLTAESPRALFDRMATLQRPGDYLFLGHSESLYRVSDRYELVGRTIYRRLAN